jgi:hypothetical protein
MERIKSQKCSVEVAPTGTPDTLDVGDLKENKKREK